MVRECLSREVFEVHPRGEKRPRITIWTGNGIPQEGLEEMA